jgi:hypothetical protein
MTELLRMPIGEDEQDGVLVVEVRPDPRDVQQVSRTRDRVIQATQTLEEALQPITRAAAMALRALRESQPTAVEVEFGVRIHARTGAVLTEAGAEGHLKVTITWDRTSAELGTSRSSAGTGPLSE